MLCLDRGEVNAEPEPLKNSQTLPKKLTKKEVSIPVISQKPGARPKYILDDLLIIDWLTTEYLSRRHFPRSNARVLTPIKRTPPATRCRFSWASVAKSVQPAQLPHPVDGAEMAE